MRISAAAAPVVTPARVTATKANPLKVPIVIRLTGTNEEIAMKILTENGFSASSDMDEAVQKAVALAKGGN